MKTIMRVALCVSLLACAFNFAAAEKTASDAPKKMQIAYKRYDVVNIYELEKVEKGVVPYTYEWNKMKWFFKSRANLEKFKKTPKKYAPEFEGHCACGVASNVLLEANPEVYQIFEGKLYLFHSKEKRDIWDSNIDVFPKRAAQNYLKLYSAKF